MKKIVRSSPEDVFDFLKSVKSLGKCTIEQIRSKMGLQWPPVRLAKSFCEEFNLVEISDKTISLTEISGRLLRFTGQKRIDFLKSSYLLAREPFKYLIEELGSLDKEFTSLELSKVIKLKFFPKAKWEKTEPKQVGETYCSWLEYLGIIKKEGEKFKYAGGKVIISGIEALKDFEFLMERALKHRIVDHITNSKEIIKNSLDILDKIESEQDDNKRGKLFQEFVKIAFLPLGFVCRKKNSHYERELEVFKDNTGGGDVALFHHFPLHGKDVLFDGGILGCEAKSTKSNIGGKAVGQSRNFTKKLSEKFPKYFFQPIIISRSETGLDPSGIHLAPPEVIHLNHKCILKMLEIQKKRVENNEYLITPSEIFSFFEELVLEQKLQPSEKNIENFFKKK